MLSADFSSVWTCKGSWNSALVKYPKVSSQHHLLLAANSRSHFNIPHSCARSALQTLLSQASAVCVTVTFQEASHTLRSPGSAQRGRESAERRERGLAGAGWNRSWDEEQPPDLVLQVGTRSQTPGFPWQLLLLVLEIAVGLQLQFHCSDQGHQSQG